MTRGFVIERLLATWLLLLVVTGCGLGGKMSSGWDEGYTKNSIDKNSRLTVTLGEYNQGDTPRMFIGTKNDLVDKIDEKSKVDDLVVDRFMNRHEEVDFIRTSSKENCNIKEIFKELVIKILVRNKLDYDRLG